MTASDTRPILKSSRRQKQSPDSNRAAPPRGGADYRRRLYAAGFDPDGEPPKDQDAFRNALARRISMYINTWQGCPETLCRRQRGCMAPHIRCSNVERQSPEEEARQWREAQPDIARALRTFFAKHGRTDV